MDFPLVPTSEPLPEGMEAGSQLVEVRCEASWGGLACAVANSHLAAMVLLAQPYTLNNIPAVACAS